MLAYDSCLERQRARRIALIAIAGLTYEVQARRSLVVLAGLFVSLAALLSTAEETPSTGQAAAKVIWGKLVDVGFAALVMQLATSGFQLQSAREGL